MSKPIRILVIFLLIDVVAVGVYFGAKALKSRSVADVTKGHEWTEAVVEDHLDLALYQLRVEQNPPRVRWHAVHKHP